MVPEIQPERMSGDPLPEPVRTVPGDPAGQPAGEGTGRQGGDGHAQVTEPDEHEVPGTGAGDRLVHEPQRQPRREYRQNRGRHHGAEQGHGGAAARPQVT